MCEYELGKDIVEIKTRLSNVERMLESYIYDRATQEGPSTPKLPGGNGGPTGRPNLVSTGEDKGSKEPQLAGGNGGPTGRPNR